MQDHYLKEELFSLLKKDDSVFDFLQSGSLDGIWYWNLEKQTDEWMSPRFWELFGFDPAEKKHLASEWQHLIFPEDLQVAVENFNKHCADANHPYDQVVRYRHKDGSTVWVRCRGIAIRDKTGKPIRMLGAHTDITASKQAERELKTERRRLQSILEGTNVGTWEWNVETGETVFNDRWAEIIGFTLEEISPTSIETWMKFANPDDLENSNQLLEKHFNGEAEYYEIECRMKHKDGYWVWVFDRGKVFSWTAEGKPLMMFGTHQDISERKRAELALIKSEERFQQLSKHDDLTGLLNRRGWNECIEDEETRIKRSGHQSCVIIVDLDGLKKINDVHGHTAGDELIRRTAHCLKHAFRNVDKVARIGGDEFAILGVEYTSGDIAIILNRIEEALSVESVMASWGAALSNPDSGLKGAIAEADRLMYKMKEKRRISRST